MVDVSGAAVSGGSVVTAVGTVVVEPENVPVVVDDEGVFVVVGTEVVTVGRVASVAGAVVTVGFAVVVLGFVVVVGFAVVEEGPPQSSGSSASSSPPEGFAVVTLSGASVGSPLGFVVPLGFSVVGVPPAVVVSADGTCVRGAQAHDANASKSAAAIIITVILFISSP